MYKRLAVLSLSSLLLVGCGAETPEPVVEEKPAIEIQNLSLENENASAPLAARLSFSTSIPTTVDITINDGERIWNIPTSAEVASYYSLMVLGMCSGRTNAVTATARDASGNVVSSDPVTYDTPPFPDNFVVPDVLVSKPELMEPGVTLIELNQWDEHGDTIKEFGAVFYVLDNEGEVVWYYHADHNAGAAIRLENGNILYYSDSKYIIEIDMLGNTVGRWHATGLAPEGPEGSIPVEVDSFHHEVTRLPNGNTLVLSSDPESA